MILIYDDNVHNNGALMMALQSIMNMDVRICTSSTILNGCLDTSTLLVMPGGADLYFCEKLDGEGNKRIREFVYNGGSYLGICAGAYYGCSSLDWACGEISGSRELGFFDGKATGPIYDFIERPNDIYNGSWVKAAEIETSDGQKFLTQYNGGPVFEETDDNVIARYCDLKNNPPAIIEGTVGQGCYILSSPHIENFGQILIDGLYKHFNNSYNKEKEQIDKLLEHEQAQKEFFKSIIERLL